MHLLLPHSNECQLKNVRFPLQMTEAYLRRMTEQVLSDLNVSLAILRRTTCGHQAWPREFNGI